MKIKREDKREEVEHSDAYGGWRVLDANIMWKEVGGGCVWSGVAVSNDVKEVLRGGGGGGG